MKINRKLLCLTAIAASMVGTAAVAQPFKIALVETLSGPQASTGLMFKAAARYALDNINKAGGWNGEPVVLLEYDNQGGPVGAAEKLKQAIADGAQAIVQGASSAIAGQISGDVRKHNIRDPENKVVYFNVGAYAMGLTGDQCQFHHFRFAPNAAIIVKTLVAAMESANTLGKNVYTINQNYSWGQDFEAEVVRDADGKYKVVGKTLHDVNKIQDFAPFIAKIREAHPDSVFTGNWSNDLLLMMKAAKSGGLNARFATAFLDQPGNLANAGEAALGSYVSHAFDAEAGGQASADFAEDYKSKVGHYPVYIEPGTVFGLMLVGEALKAVKPENGKLNVDKFAIALEAAKYKTPIGELSMRAADHQALLPIVVSEVGKDAKYKVDGTSMGFVPVRTLTAAEAATPVQASCKMKRPS